MPAKRKSTTAKKRVTSRRSPSTAKRKAPAAKPLSIAEIKRRTAKTEPLFFSPRNMKFFGQKMSDYQVKKLSNGTYLLKAPVRDKSGKKIFVAKTIFNPRGNTLRPTK